MSTEKVLELQEILESWREFSPRKRVRTFRSLTRDLREDLFMDVSSPDQYELLSTMPEHERRTYMRVLPPDDAADVVQDAPEEERAALLDVLDSTMRREVVALLVYAEDDAGGLMNPRFARLRPEMTIDEAISYLRLQGRQVEIVYYAYVLDLQQRLLGVVTFRELFAARGDRRVDEIMERDLVSVAEDTDQEVVAHLCQLHDLMAIPVLDSEGRIKGIVTVDDIVDVVQEEASEDMQKIGGMEALEAPYMETGLWEMIRKRGGWLIVLFFGGMLAASAMERYEDELSKAIVLAIFVPLIIASGGNCGSQASTLAIRAMALGEIRLRDWWKVLRRELATGALLGAVLAVLGWLRVFAGEAFGKSYGEHYMLIGITVGISLIGIVLFGTVVGSMLPFVLQRAGIDPATASAPLVATVVDLTGLIIYFTVASLVLQGTLL